MFMLGLGANLTIAQHYVRLGYCQYVSHGSAAAFAAANGFHNSILVWLLVMPSGASSFQEYGTLIRIVAARACVPVPIRSLRMCCQYLMARGPSSAMRSQVLFSSAVGTCAIKRDVAAILPGLPPSSQAVPIGFPPSAYMRPGFEPVKSRIGCPGTKPLMRAVPISDCSSCSVVSSTNSVLFAAPTCNGVVCLLRLLTWR